MPELPEVETVRATLAGAITGAVIDDVRLGGFTGCIAAPTPEEFRRRVSGRRITSLGRRGKYLLLTLDSNETIAVHLRMTGELAAADPDEPHHPHHHLTFVLDNGRQLRYSDTRKFGRLRLLTPPEMASLDASLGPEPFDESLTPEWLRERLSQRQRAIKPLLLEQTFLAGIGNIYADEALFAAGIHPLRPANSLSLAEVTALLSALRETLRSAIDRRGTTFRNYRDGLGQPGENQSYLRMYSLNAGDPCPNCGTPVARLVVGQRGTRFCPACQPLDSLITPAVEGGDRR